VLRIFITLKNSSPRTGFEPANLRSGGKHAKHYTTEATTLFNIERKSYSLCEW
jgi:hypothetical protein